MTATHGFHLAESDLPLLQYVYELRLATGEHLAALTGRSYKRTQERLAKLEAQRYLKRVTHRPQKHVYVIGPESVPLLIEHGYAPRELGDKRMRENELKPLGIQHAVFIADIHTKLILLARARSLRVTTWTEGPSLWDRVTTSDNIEVPIRPDSRFAIEGPFGLAHFFLEADRGTMAHSRMREKIAGYAAYFRQKLHTKRYEGMETFRVVTVTETRKRANELHTEFPGMLPAKWLAAYPVAALEDLTLEALMPELVRETGA
jgi:hypothetical protein